MAGEIQLNSTTFATESSGTITVSNVDSATNRQNLGLEIGVDVQQYDADTTKNDVANTFTANQIISVTDNTNAALRVTQLGTGNALVVEDSTNPDSTPFVVDASGNVGIGTSSPASALDVAGDITFGDGHFIGNGTGDNLEIVSSSAENILLKSAGGNITFGNTSTEAMRIISSDQLLVGYTSSNGSYKLQVNSQIYATSSTIATSDGNYKENITPLDSVLFLVSQLNPVQFDWKEHPVHEFDRNQPTVGFIAQEVQKVLSDQPYVNSIVKSNECTIEPEEIDKEGNVIKEAVTEEFLGIAEGNLVALLTKAIQEQQALIESQQSQIDALTARIEALETT